jgi:hypothetical protein
VKTNTIKLHADGNITCKTHQKRLVGPQSWRMKTCQNSVGVNDNLNMPLNVANKLAEPCRSYINLISLYFYDLSLSTEALSKQDMKLHLPLTNEVLGIEDLWGSGYIDSLYLELSISWR